MPERRLSADEVEEYYEHYLQQRGLLDELTKRVDKQKAALKNYAERYGIEDESGNRWVTFEDGRSFQRQARKSESLDADKVKDWLTELGRLPECMETVTTEVLSEDAFLSVVDDEKLTGAHLADFYTKKYTYAFIPGTS